MKYSETKCGETRFLLSSYLDGAMTGRQMCSVSRHLAGCPGCSAEYAMLRETQRRIGELGRKQPPPELALKLRVAISREAALPHHPRLTGVRARLDHTVQAFMVPATAGAVSAILMFALLIGFFALPPQLRASNNDVPTLLYTPPVLSYSPVETGVAGTNGDSIVIVADVDAQGRVTGYRMLSAPADVKALSARINELLIFTQFQPATAFGRPTPGHAILSFSHVSVKG